MAGNIKGITVEIGGDTVGLQNALRDVNNRSRDLQSELKQVERALKFNPGNIELLAQKQQILSEQIINTAEKLDRLKEAQAQVQDQFERGEIGADQYRAFQREVIQTESRLNQLQQSLRELNSGSSANAVRQDLSHVSNEAEDAKGAVKELGGELTNLVVGAAAAGGLSEVIEKSLDTSSLNTKIDISFEVPDESVRSVKNALSTVETYGVEAESALEGVRRQWALNKTESDESNTAVVKGAAAIAAAYGDIDFTELIQETNEISQGFGITNNEALGIINSLLKMGFPPDQLDIITEYGDQLKRAGYNAQEIQGIFKAGVDTGTWNIDVLLDGLKEGRIVMAEFGQGVDKSTAQLLKGTSISAKQLQQWGQDVADGGEKGKEAMVKVATALNGVKDETKKNALGVKIFGTLYEENGQNIIDTLLNAKNATGDLKTNQDQLNQSIKQLDKDPSVRLKTSLSNLQTALTPLLTSIAEFVAKVADWAAKNPTLAATITAVATTLGILIGIGMALAPIFTALSVAAGALEIGLLPLIGIVVAVVAVIALLVAAGVAIYKNWDTIKAKAVEIWGVIVSFLSKTWSNLKSMAVNVFNSILSFFQKWGPTILAALAGPIGLLVLFVVKNWTKIKSTSLQIWSNIKSAIVGKAQEIWSNVKSKFESIRQAISDPIRNAVNFVRGQIEKIKGFFSNLRLKLPHIKLPHFGLSGKFSLSPPSVPKLTVDWYKNGGVFPANSPRVVGIGDANVPEAAIPLSDEVLGKIGAGIAKNMSVPQGNTNLILELDGEIIGQIILPYINRGQDRETRVKLATLGM